MTWTVLKRLTIWTLTATLALAPAQADIIQLTDADHVRREETKQTASSTESVLRIAAHLPPGTLIRINEALVGTRKFSQPGSNRILVSQTSWRTNVEVLWVPPGSGLNLEILNRTPLYFSETSLKEKSVLVDEAQFLAYVNKGGNPASYHQTIGRTGRESNQALSVHQPHLIRKAVFGYTDQSPFPGSDLLSYVASPQRGIASDSRASRASRARTRPRAARRTPVATPRGTESLSAADRLNQAQLSQLRPESRALVRSNEGAGGTSATRDTPEIGYNRATIEGVLGRFANIRHILNHPITCHCHKEVHDGMGEFGAPRGGGSRLHEGLDMRVPMNTPVATIAAGRVVAVRYIRGFGRTVVIEHEGLGIRTVYAHLNRYQVKEGDRVESGQIIAKSGNSGVGTGPHLHFEIRVIDDNSRYAQATKVSTWGTPVNPREAFPDLLQIASN